MRIPFLVLAAAFAVSCSPAQMTVDDGAIEASAHDATNDHASIEDAVDVPIDAADVVVPIDVVDTAVRDVPPPPRDVVDVQTGVDRCATATTAPYNACSSDCECGTGSICGAVLSGTDPEVCLPPCVHDSDCPQAGPGTLATCTFGGRCRLGCGPQPTDCPSPLTCHRYPGSSDGYCGP